MSQYTPQDESQKIVAEQGQRIGNIAKNKAGKAAKNALKKGTQKILANLAKKGLMGLVKALVSALINLGAILLPYLIALIVTVLIITSMWDFLTFEWVNEPAENGQFQVESVNQNNVVIKNGSTIEQIQTSLGNDMAGIFYTKYAKSGYFYTIDTNSTIIPGDLTGEIKDFEGRESMFLLSPQMLMALDLGLNGSYKIPEQFVKPIYNSCMIEGEGKSTDGYCKLLNLMVDGKIQPQGSVYEERKYTREDVKPEGVSSDFVGTLYVKTEKQDGSVYDWGLAPIFHYQSFQEDSRVVNYAITNVQIYNPVTKKIEYKDYADLTNEEKKAYPVPPSQFNYGDKEDVSKQLPKPETKYAIDNVVSFLGTINSPVVQKWIPQGKFQQTSYIDKEILTAATTAEMLNESLVKRVCTEKTCQSGTKVELVPDTTDAYMVSDSYSGNVMTSVVSVEVVKTIQLAYTKVGTLEVNTVEYVDDEPNTSGIVGTEYLENYIDAYQTYIPLSGVGPKRFACYEVGGVFSDKDWDVEKTNNSFSRQQVLDAINSFKTATPISYQNLPSGCENGQVALSVTDEAMDKFYFDEMPNLQYLMIAKLLNYQLSVNEEDKLMIESTLSTMSGVEKPNITSYRKMLDTYTNRFDDIVTKYASAYGIDENLIYAIMMAKVESGESGGCSLSDGAGCGVMSVKAALTNSAVLTVKNYSTGSTEELVLNESRLISDNEYNIRFGIATLQNLMNYYEGNMLLAVQAYTSTTHYTDIMVAESNSQKNRITDIQWTALIKAYGVGDSDFLRRVLGSTISDVMQFNVNGTVTSVDFSFLRTVQGTTSTALIKNLNQFIANKYFLDESIDLESIWNLLYLGQKAYDSTRYNDVASGTLVDTKGVSLLDKESIILSLFAFSEGKAIQNYEDMDEEFWRTKVRTLFMNTTQRGLDVLYPVQKYIGGTISSPVKLSSHYVVVRDFGTVSTEDGGTTMYDDVIYRTAAETEILSVTDGKIYDIVKGRNGKDASITIIAPAITTEQDGKTINLYQASFYYSELGEISETLKVGDEIKSGTVLGKVSNQNDYQFSLSYYLNGKPIDANLIVEYVQYLLAAEESYYGEWSSRTNPNWVNGLAGMNFENITFSGSATWFNPVEGGEITSGTWAYTGGATLNGNPHDAADIANTIGTPIKALGDGVILDYIDTTPDYNGTTVPRITGNPTKHNFMTYVMMKNGNVYTVQLIHLQQGSARVSSYTFKEGDILGNVGDNGHSTGPHVHMSVINHGPNVSVQDIVDIYTANPGKPFFGINPRYNPSDRCEVKSTYPCGVPVDKLINW